MSTVDAATVFFGNLDLECQNEDLAQLLEGWEFTKIAIINDSNGCSRGYALVTFASEDVANNAVVYFHDVIFQSRTLEVFEKMSFFVSSLLRKDFPKSHAWCEKMAAPVNMPAPSLLRMLSSGSRQIASTSSTSEITTLLINVSKAYRVGKITAEQKEQMKYLLATGDLAAARQSLEQLTKFRSKKKKQKKNMQSRRHGSGRVMSTRKIKVFSPTTKFSNPRRAKESDLQPVPAVPVIISETVSFLNIRPEELWERCFERVDLAVITPSACMSELTNVIAPSSTQQGQQLPAPRKVTFNDGTVWYTRCIAMSKESSDRYFVQWESWLDTRVGLLNGWTQWQLPCSACLTLKEYGEFSSTQRRNKQPSAMRCRLCVLQHRESIPLFLHRRDSITLIATQSGTSARWGVCFPFPRRSPVEDVRSCASKILSAFEEVRQRMNPNSIMATTTCDVEGEEKRQRHPVLSCTVWSIIFRYLADGHFASTQLVSRRFHRSIVDSFFKLPFPFVPTEALFRRSRQRLVVLVPWYKDSCFDQPLMKQQLRSSLSMPLTNRREERAKDKVNMLCPQNVSSCARRRRARGKEMLSSRVRSKSLIPVPLRNFGYVSGSVRAAVERGQACTPGGFCMTLQRTPMLVQSLSDKVGCGAHSATLVKTIQVQQGLLSHPSVCAETIKRASWASLSRWWSEISQTLWRWTCHYFHQMPTRLAQWRLTSCRCREQ